MELLTKLEAFVRLKSIEAKKTDMECNSNEVLKLLFAKCDNHLDRVKVLDMAGMKLQDIIYRDLQKASKEHVVTEKAHDLVRAVNLKTA